MTDLDNSMCRHNRLMDRCANAGFELVMAALDGFLLFFAPPAAHPALRKEFAGYQLLEVKLNAPGSQIIFAG